MTDRTEGSPESEVGGGDDVDADLSGGISLVKFEGDLLGVGTGWLGWRMSSLRFTAGPLSVHFGSYVQDRYL